MQKAQKIKKEKEEQIKKMQSSFADGNQVDNQLEQTKNQNITNQVQNDHPHIQQETTGQNFDSVLIQPYQFLRYANPPIHTIFVPHFSVKSINFGLTIVFILAFVILLIYNYIKPQDTITWNCSLFQLQNKYYPRIRYNYQFWRIPISGIFHSNIAHFVLDLFGLQIYGYFIQWYYGKLRYTITAIISIIFGHLLGCLTQITTISTMSSGILFSFLALKLYFFYQYWDYKPLINRKIFIYLLYVLILLINLIPIFVSNNVDYSSYLGGFICGGLLGLTFYIMRKQTLMVDGQQSPRYLKVLKFAAPILLGCLTIAFIAIIFILDSPDYQATNNSIDQKCSL